MRIPFRSLGLSAFSLLLVPAAHADEGMWTFDNLPRKQLKEKYGFEPDQAWLDHLRLAAVNFGGGSASFVSADGLVITNHHVGRGSIQRLSTKDNDLIKNGFVAKTMEEERKVPGLVVRTLMTMENVTERVAGAGKAGVAEAEAVKQRRKELETLRVEAEKKSGLSCEAVTLYHGGEYWIYGYKRHTDVRLVAAPEMQVAFFGGDPDNFTYPRHNLDFCLFRVYEDGKPYHPQHFLKWTDGSLKAGDLTFVAGNPASTSRLNTVAQMKYDRDFGLPLRLKMMERMKDAYLQYAKRSPEHARQVNTMIFGIENSLKASRGYLSGLKNKEAMARIEAAEAELKAKVAADPKLAAKTGQSWGRIEKATIAQKALAKENAALNTRGFTYINTALDIVRIAVEEAKPADKRDPEYSEASIRTRKVRLQSPGGGPFGGAPNPELDTYMLASGLEEVEKELGPTHKLVKALLGGRKPAEAAKALLEGSRIMDPGARKPLLEGGLKAVEASQDALIVLARKILPISMDLRRKLDDRVTSVLAEHGGRIAAARFAVYGKSTYPDATRSLRLTFGPVSGYPANGTLIQPFTTFHGLFDRYEGWGGNAAKVENGAWTLPQRWLERKARLNLDTPFNFVNATDTIGGNSGSPVVDRGGRLVGLLFDGNIDGLPCHYYYDAKVNRSVCVDARAIAESLDKVMDAPHLVKELTGK